MKKTLLITIAFIALLALYKKQHIQPVDNPKESPLFQQRLKGSLESFREEGSPAMQQKKQSPGSPLTQTKPPSYAPSPTGTTGIVATGRCGTVILTWFEDQGIDKESINVRRKAAQEEYTPVPRGLVYERPEQKGIRYWVSDSGLIDGVHYEYLVACKDASGKEIVKGPAAIDLTCTEQDRALLAQREKTIKEYYQKKGMDYDTLKASSYQLSKEVYTIALGTSPQKGRSDAPVTLVVFTDFECYYCSTWAQTLDALHKAFPTEVKIIFKNYPIPYHKNSELAALAALAAGEQGKFWEMHDLLFMKQNALGYENLLGYAKTLGLEEVKFQKALESAKLKSLLEQDTAQGKTLGVQNIPTTFINGRSLVGSPPVSYIKKIIEELLKK